MGAELGAEVVDATEADDGAAEVDDRDEGADEGEDSRDEVVPLTVLVGEDFDEVGGGLVVVRGAAVVDEASDLVVEVSEAAGAEGGALGALTAAEDMAEWLFYDRKPKIVLCRGWDALGATTRRLQEASLEGVVSVGGLSDK